MQREILEIDEDLCVGCGHCVPKCHQGALQIIDGKARLISDLMCEGIGGLCRKLSYRSHHHYPPRGRAV